jgi:hypothetical protein
MVIIENPDAGQMESKNFGKEKRERAGAQVCGNYCAYHAARFHDQTGFLNMNHAKRISAVFAAFARTLWVNLTHNACRPRIQPVKLPPTCGVGEPT